MKTVFGMLMLCLTMACTTQNAQITSINETQLKELATKENVILLDVRTPAEVSQGYIKGTKHFIDYNDANFEQKLDGLEKGKTYIVYCRSGNRSTKALNIMAQKGFKNLYELQHGIMGVSADNIVN